MFEIKKYSKEYENELMALIEAEGKVCGYSRSLKDALFIYICDLLVNEKFRGYGLGNRLMQCLKTEYPSYPIYVVSGNDEYYQTIGAKKEGSVYLL